MLDDGTSHLVFDDPFKICNGSCLAATTIGFFDDAEKKLCDGLVVVEITDSDVFFNTKTDFHSAGDPPCTSFPPGSWEFSLEAVTTHEIGHLIGLAHSGNGEALMAPSIGPCDNKVLHADDIASRDELYDCDSFTVCAGSETSCTDDVDNDCNGLTDCAESVCSSEEDCLPDDGDGCVNAGGLPAGAECSSDSVCCSDKCKGRTGSKSCKG